MSAATLGVLEILKARFAGGVKPATVTDNDISQYNITVNGKIVKTVVFNLKDFVCTEVANPNRDVEITLDDKYVVDVFTGKLTLVDLNKIGEVLVQGNEALLQTLDERGQRIAAAQAAAAKQ